MLNKLISFKIAKILKDVGFESKSRYYNSAGELADVPDNPGIDYRHTNNMMQRFRYEAPPLSEVISWLYEKYNVWIWVKLDDYDKKFYFRIVEDSKVRFKSVESLQKFKDPFSAYEEAIKYYFEIVANED